MLDAIYYTSIVLSQEALLHCVLHCPSIRIVLLAQPIMIEKEDAEAKLPQRDEQVYLKVLALVVPKYNLLGFPAFDPGEEKSGKHKQLQGVDKSDRAEEYQHRDYFRSVHHKIAFLLAVGGF